MKNLVDRALDGYACTAFAFGQTGSGKTHTITGPDEGNDDGVIQRAIRFLWRQVASRARTTYSFQASYLEIYNEQVRGHGANGIKRRTQEERYSRRH